MTYLTQFPIIFIGETLGRLAQASPSSIGLTLAGKEVIYHRQALYSSLYANCTRLGDNYHTLPDCSVVFAHFTNSLSRGADMTKEKDKIIKTTKTSVIVEHPVYSDDKLVGWAKSTLFKATPEGLNELKANLTMSHLKDINRQIKTDDKNNLRRGTTLFAALRQLAKGNPFVAQLLDVLVKEAQEGKVNAKTLEAIESLVKAA